MDTIKCFASGSQAKSCKNDFAAVVKSFNPKAYPIKRYSGSSLHKCVSANSLLAKNNGSRTF